MKPIDPVFEGLCERIGIQGHELMPVLREHVMMHVASVSSANAAVELHKKLYWENKAREGTVAGILYRIAQQDYGLQSLHEDDASEDEIRRYLLECVASRRRDATEALNILQGQGSASVRSNEVSSND